MLFLQAFVQFFLQGIDPLLIDQAFGMAPAHQGAATTEAGFVILEDEGEPPGGPLAEIWELVGRLFVGHMGEKYLRSSIPSWAE